LGVTISNWDLGGQESFRKNYLEHKDKFFTDTKTIFFVIDSQRPERYEEAIDYLSQIINAIAEISEEKPHFLVLLHKCDPDIKADPELNRGITDVMNKIKTLSDEVRISFYKTSIYDEASILKAFSDGAVSVTAKAQLIQTLLKEYTGKSFNSAAVLLDQHCLIIASRATKNSYERICQEIAPRLTHSMEKLEEWNINTIDIVTNIEFPQDGSAQNREGIIFLRKLDLDTERMYLISLCLNKKIKAKSYEYLPILAENLKNLLQSFE